MTVTQKESSPPSSFHSHQGESWAAAPSLHLQALRTTSESLSLGGKRKGNFYFPKKRKRSREHEEGKGPG